MEKPSSTAFECHVCSKLFFTANARDRHRQRCHLVGKGVMREEIGKEDNAEADSKMPRELFQRVVKPKRRTEVLCLICLESFASEEVIHKHWNVIHCKK